MDLQKKYRNKKCIAEISQELKDNKKAFEDGTLGQDKYEKMLVNLEATQKKPQRTFSLPKPNTKHHRATQTQKNAK